MRVGVCRRDGDGCYSVTRSAVAITPFTMGLSVALSSSYNHHSWRLGKIRESKHGRRKPKKDDESTVRSSAETIAVMWRRPSTGAVGSGPAERNLKNDLSEIW